MIQASNKIEFGKQRHCLRFCFSFCLSARGNVLLGPGRVGVGGRSSPILSGVERTGDTLPNRPTVHPFLSRQDQGCICFAAGGTFLAVAQEDFLVC